jgi:hypothetical protein
VPIGAPVTPAPFPESSACGVAEGVKDGVASGVVGAEGDKVAVGDADGETEGVGVSVE